MKKRILAILLTICMLMSMLPVGAFAADVEELPTEAPEVYAAETEPEAAADESAIEDPEADAEEIWEQSEDDDQIISLASIVDSGSCGENVSWKLDGDGNLSVTGRGAMADYSFYSRVPWYSYSSSVKAVTIAEGVTSIGGYAFSHCSSLTSVTIPDSVTTIGNYAFSSCASLTSVTIPGSVFYIGNSAFSSCSSLTSVTIGNGVTRIPNDAFFYCSSLTSVTIPNSVTSIGDAAFVGCSSLTELMVDEKNAYYCSTDGVLFNKAKTTLVCYPSGKVGAYTIPDSVTTIGAYAFNGCRNLTSVTIPESVTSIGDGAFQNCSSLTSVTIPDSITSIGSHAFGGCSSLTSVTIGNSVTSIGSYAFSGCSSLNGVTIPDSVTSIGYAVFKDCSSLTSVTIPDSVTTIGNYAFEDCSSLTDVTIPDSVTSIGSYAFRDCSRLNRVDITSIEAWCKISFVDSYSNPLYYAHNLYLNEELVTELVIPDSVTTIGKSAFGNCSSLTSVTIPNSVTRIGKSAFSGCSSLTNVYYGGNEAQWQTISIDSDNYPLTDATINYNSCIIPALGHDMISDESVAATCTETGLTAGSHCTRCDYAVAQETIPALGHNLITDAAVAATCTETGLTEGSHCTRCDYVIAQEEAPALGHDWDDGKVTKSPSCLVEGTKTYTCSRCQTTRKETIAKTEHVAAAAPENVKKASCTASGYTGDTVCSVCGALIESGVTIPAFGHNIVTDAAVTATCTSPGLTAGSHCSRCDYAIAQETVPALGHSWDKGSISKAPTCTVDGVKTYTCSTCKGTKTEVVAKLGHDVVQHSVKAATCTEAGNDAYVTCSRCDYTTYKEIPANGHTTATKDSKPATCTEDGYTGTGYCTVCGETLESNVIIPALGHAISYTIHNDGTHTGACTRCDYSITEEHSYTSVATAPTCTEGGFTTHTCSACGYSYTDSETAAFGHDIVNGVCSRCNRTFNGKKGSEYPLTVGTKTTAKISTSGTIYYFSFTPEYSCKYTFYSTGSSDTYGYLYNSSYSQLTTNDDGGSSSNFKIEYNLKAGTTYYFGVKYYSSSSTGSISVQLDGHHSYTSVVTAPTCTEGEVVN